MLTLATRLLQPIWLSNLSQICRSVENDTHAQNLDGFEQRKLLKLIFRFTSYRGLPSSFCCKGLLGWNTNLRLFMTPSEDNLTGSKLSMQGRVLRRIVQTRSIFSLVNAPQRPSSTRNTGDILTESST